MELIELLEQNAATIVTDSLAAMRRAHLQHYEAAGASAMRARLQALFDVTLTSLKTRHLAPIETYAQAIAHERHLAGFDLGELQIAFNVLEEALWHRIERELAPTQLAEALGLVSTVLGTGKDMLARTYVALATRTQAPAIDLHALFRGTPGA